MIRKITVAFVAALLLALGYSPSRAACDYDVGGASPFLMTTFEAQLDEEFGCIGTILGGLDVGSDVQAFDADLTTWAGLTPSANFQTLVIQTFAQMRASLDLEAGTDFNAFDADLATWAGLTPSANAQSLVTAANYAAMRALLDLEAATDFLSPAAIAAAYQPLDADLTTWAGITPGANVGTALATPSSANLRTAVTDEVGTGALMFGLTTGMADDLACTASQVVRRNSGDTAFECATFAGGGDALVANSLAQFAATTSLELAGVISDETGSGAAVFATSPTFVTPALGTPSSGTLTNATGLPVASGISGLGTGVATALATPSGTNLAAAFTDESGTGVPVFTTSPTLVTPALGTPSAAVLTNGTGLPIATGITGSSADLKTALSDEIGTGLAMFGLISTMSDDLGCTASQIIARNAGDTAFECITAAGGGNAQTADPLSQFAATTSAQLAGVISDEVGSGPLMFGLATTMQDGLTCSASQVVRRNSADTAFECGTLAGAATPDVQTMTATGSGDSWDKPAGGQTMCMVELWGAGGSGGKGAAATAGHGGGGGMYIRKFFLMSALGSTEQVTIGAGGASQTTASNPGSAGGNTTFGTSGTLVTAYGGGAGSLGGTEGAGNGGGPNSAGGTRLNQFLATTYAVANFTVLYSNEGLGGRAGVSTAGENGISTTFNGAGGGSASDGATAENGHGGNSQYGGGGGGAGAEDAAPGAGPGGTSQFGGNGGAGSFDATAATAGSQPGGGGGGAEAGNSGAGGDGKAVITCW